MHIVAVLASEGVVAFDLSTPCEVFSRVRGPDGSAPYEVRVCGVTREIDAGPFRIRTRYGLGSVARAQTVIVPGVSDLDAEVPAAVVRALRNAAQSGARVASICTGAFVLAATGLLDGRRATTHWRAAAELARRHPSIRVDPDVLYIDDGNLLTSAGAAAGLDLCLHLVRRDYGAAVAADTARLSVMPLERDGGQAQFIVHEAPAAAGSSLEPLLRWMAAHLDHDLELAHLARRAAMSPRTFIRRFREQTGTTPAKWVMRSRVRRAQHLLETTRHPVERIAGEAGFGSTATFRERFHNLVGTSPQAYRGSFRS